MTTPQNLIQYDPKATPERSPLPVIRAQTCQLANLDQACILLNAVPSPILILNAHRQTVLANQRVREMLGTESLDEFYGQRPGEILKCSHACETPGGCGTAEACSTCGAAKAIAATERGAAAVQECRITQQDSGEALDLRISTTPFQIGTETFTVLAITDISHEKRRHALDRIFFHDLLNTAGALLWSTKLLPRVPAHELEQECHVIERISNTLIGEIQAQRDLTAAENKDLQVHPQPLDARALVEEVVVAARQLAVAESRTIIVDPVASHTPFSSDPVLLARVLGNLIKNALEASTTGQTVTVGCKLDGPHVEFWVHNPAAMPRTVQLQVFQRSFSTKGKGRGLGTYSIKLLTERYLRGTVSFTTSPEAGTIFHARYPLQL